MNTFIKIDSQKEYAKVAQLVERDLAKVEVAGSRPVFRSKKEPRLGVAFLFTEVPKPKEAMVFE